MLPPDTTMNETHINVSDTYYEEPMRDSLYIVVPVTCVYLCIFISGLVGNIVTCIVISRNKHMHTATNYYLFSLACSDLLLLVSGLPQEMYYIWSRYPYVFGEVFCVLRGLAAETSANATVLTITAFTVERYVAICHPFLSHNFSKLSRALRCITLIWLLALALAVPQALQFGVIVPEHYPLFSECTIKWTLISHAFEISTIVFFIAPMSLITVLYVLIGFKLRRSRLLNARNKRGSISSSTERRRETVRGTVAQQNYVIKMLVAVVVGFFVCWAPFHAQRLLAIYGNNTHHFTTAVYTSLTYISGVLYYLSTSINPLLYHLMSHKFRGAFKATLAQLFTRGSKKEIQRMQTYSMMCGQRQPHNTVRPRQRQLSMTDDQNRTKLANSSCTSHRNNSLPSVHGEIQGRLLGRPVSATPDAHSYPCFIGRRRGGSESSQITMTTSLGKLSLDGVTRVTALHQADSISNSSLQDREIESSGAELAHYLGEHVRQ